MNRNQTRTRAGHEYTVVPTRTHESGETRSPGTVRRRFQSQAGAALFEGRGPCREVDRAKLIVARTRRAARGPGRESSRRSTVPVIASASVCALVLVCVFCGVSGAQTTQGSTRELSRDQDSVRALVASIASKMRSVAKTLEKSSPDEAKKLRDAAQIMDTRQLAENLTTIRDLLKNEQFLAALSKQDRAVETIDSILVVLEAQQFAGVKNADERLDELRSTLGQVSKLREGQEKLLEQTRELRSEQEGLDGLRGLKSVLDKLREMQRGLVEGKSADELDPAADAEDSAVLERALDLAKSLEKAQNRVNEGLDELAKS